MKEIIFFGGGKLTFKIMLNLLKKTEFTPILFAARRHLNEKIFNNESLKKHLLKKKIKFFQTEKITVSHLKNNLNIDKIFFAVSIGSPWIFKKDIINFFKKKIYNIHGSELPKDKGGGGFSWQILQEKKRGFVKIHFLTEGIDEGNIILSSNFKIKNFNPFLINEVYVKKALHLFEKLVNRIKSGKKIKGIPQNKKNSSYWPRLNSEIHGWINWDWKGNEINTFIKSFGEPYIGAHTLCKDQKIYIKDSKFFRKYNFHPFQYGLIFKIDKLGLWVCVKNGCLLIKKILFEKKIKTKNFLKLGDRLYTPQKILEKAKTKRVYYHL